MEPPATTAELHRRIDDAYAEFAAAIAAVPTDRLTTAGTVGEWSARDVIAHVGGDEQWMAGQLEALRSGELPTALSCYGSDEPVPKGFDGRTRGTPGSTSGCAASRSMRCG